MSTFKFQQLFTILILATSVCAGCGVRGPLTLYPNAGSSSAAGNARTEPAQPDANVLYGAKGERVALPAPAAAP